MGVLTFLVSDEKREWCEMGKLFLDEELVAAAKISIAAKGNLAEVICEYLKNSKYDDVSDEEAASVAKVAAAWMQAHPDWRYFTEVDDAFDDVYLAVDDEDAREYQEEFPDDDSPVYKKTGSVWPS